MIIKKMASLVVRFVEGSITGNEQVLPMVGH
jgi:hypothetical protein